MSIPLMNMLFGFLDHLVILLISAVAWPVIASDAAQERPLAEFQIQMFDQRRSAARHVPAPIHGIARDLLVQGSAPPADSGTSPPEQPAHELDPEPPPEETETEDPPLELAPTPAPPATLWIVLLPVASGLVLMAAYWWILRSPSSRVP